MNISQIEWCSYTMDNSDYLKEIEFLEWQSDPEGRFLRSDVFTLFKSIVFAYSKVLEYMLNISLEEAIDLMYEKNYSRIYQKIKETFDKLQFGCGIGYSKLEEIMSEIEIPKKVKDV